MPASPIVTAGQVAASPGAGHGGTSGEVVRLPVTSPPDRQTLFSPRARTALASAFQLGGLVLLLLLLLGPFYWMVATSLKETKQTFAVPPVFVFQPTLEHYRGVINDGKVPRALLNSLIVTVSTTGLALILGTPGAYVLARVRFRRRDAASGRRGSARA